MNIRPNQKCVLITDGKHPALRPEVIGKVVTYLRPASIESEGLLALFYGDCVIDADFLARVTTTCVSTKGVVRHTELLPIGDNPDAEQLTTNSLISLFVKARDMA